MKIGIDIDEVVVEFLKGYLKVYNNKYNKNKKFEDIFSYDLWIPLEIPRDDAFKITDELYNSEDFDNLSLVEGAYNGIIKLSKENDLFFVTSRAEFMEGKTRDFFERFPNLKYKLIFTRDVWGSQEKTKANICKKLGIETIIEDNINYAFDCANLGIITYLLNKPWNQNGSLPKNIIRVENWNQILNKIN